MTDTPTVSEDEITLKPGDGFKHVFIGGADDIRYSIGLANCKPGTKIEIEIAKDGTMHIKSRLVCKQEPASDLQPVPL